MGLTRKRNVAASPCPWRKRTRGAAHAVPGVEFTALNGRAVEVNPAINTAWGALPRGSRVYVVERRVHKRTSDKFFWLPGMPPGTCVRSLRHAKLQLGLVFAPRAARCAAASKQRVKTRVRPTWGPERIRRELAGLFTEAAVAITAFPVTTKLYFGVTRWPEQRAAAHAHTARCHGFSGCTVIVLGHAHKSTVTDVFEREMIAWGIRTYGAHRITNGNRGGGGAIGPRGPWYVYAKISWAVM